MESKPLILKLADSSASVRNRAIKSLQKFVSIKQSTLDDSEIHKLWRGLFFAMFHADKPAGQRELAETFAALMDVFQEMESKMMYLQHFYLTMQEMWPQIDRFRIEKFMTLVRLMTLKCAEEGLIELALGVLTDSATPIGLSLHLVDVWPVQSSKGKYKPAAWALVEGLPKVSDRALRQRMANFVLEQWVDVNTDKKQRRECYQHAFSLASNAETGESARKLLYSITSRTDEV
jgi:hypothetical protein